ncbi:sensor histidine kinase [Halomonas sp. 707D7]|uniref:sensor histidine kinase n=2 Tax=unclassified Halomonas TaxID=2609666 RepID=UPI00209CCE64|nr:sensor histidine kinase [Halomonas sp. 707D7]MCP1313343.1 sensor histidine kinase [Halomonas sp. 707D7]
MPLFKRPFSIRARLLIWIGLPFTGLALLALGSSYLLLTRQINETFDDLLYNAAQRLERRIYTAGGELHINMHYFSISTLGSRGEGKIFYRIREVDGPMIAGFPGLGDPPGPLDEPLFYDVDYAGNALRAVALTFPYQRGRTQTTLEVIVAESKEARYTLANDFMLTLSSLMAVTGLLAMTLALFAIHRGLAPLNAIRQALRRRSPNDLRPLEENAPKEIQPLIASINQLMQRMRRSIESTQQLNADVSHQLRTPISELRALTELSLKATREPDTRANLVAMQRTAEHASHTVQQLLKYAKTRHELFDDARLEAVDLAELCRQACAKTATRIYQKGQELSFDESALAPGQGALPRVLGDPITLSWLLVNLIDNASVHAGGATPYRGSIDITLTREAERIVLAVSDSGVGIDEGKRERLTQRFVRDNPHAPGSGLGLAIVEQIATAHAATLRLANRPGGGFRVAVAFPAPRESLPDAPSRAS